MRLCDFLNIFSNRLFLIFNNVVICYYILVIRCLIGDKWLDCMVYFRLLVILRYVLFLNIVLVEYCMLVFEEVFERFFVLNWLLVYCGMV